MTIGKSFRKHTGFERASEFNFEKQTETRAMGEGGPKGDAGIPFEWRRQWKSWNTGKNGGRGEGQRWRKNVQSTSTEDWVNQGDCLTEEREAGEDGRYDCFSGQKEECWEDLIKQTVDTALSTECEEGQGRVQTSMKQKRSVWRLRAFLGYISPSDQFSCSEHPDGPHPSGEVGYSFTHSWDPPSSSGSCAPARTPASSLGGSQLGNLHPPTHHRHHHICLPQADNSEAP